MQKYNMYFSAVESPLGGLQDKCHIRAIEICE